MSFDISEQEILNVFLESDTDEEDCLIDENVTEEDEFRRNINNLDHADTELTVDVDPWDYLDHKNTYSDGSYRFETPIEEGQKCFNSTRKNFVDLASISPPASSAETLTGFMLRPIGDYQEPKKNIWICTDCGRYYSSKGGVQRHCKIHLGKNLHACKFCQKQFHRKDHLDVHVRTHKLHLGKNLHTCKYCQKQFYRKDHLDVHVRTHTRERHFTCFKCLKSFVSKVDLCQHKKSCINQDNMPVDLTSVTPPANCEESIKGFMVRPIGESQKPRYICLDCGKHYSHIHSLKNHRNLHLRINLHTCEFCQKQFTRKDEYEDHVRSHTGEKPFTCPRCFKCFGYKTNLREHKKRWCLN